MNDVWLDDQHGHVRTMTWNPNRSHVLIRKNEPSDGHKIRWCGQGFYTPLIALPSDFSSSAYTALLLVWWDIRVWFFARAGTFSRQWLSGLVVGSHPWGPSTALTNSFCTNKMLNYRFEYLTWDLGRWITTTKISPRY